MSPYKLDDTLQSLYNASFVEDKDIVPRDILVDLVVMIHGDSGLEEIMAEAASHILDLDVTASQGLRDV